MFIRASVNCYFGHLSDRGACHKQIILSNIEIAGRVLNGEIRKENVLVRMTDGASDLLISPAIM